MNYISLESYNARYSESVCFKKVKEVAKGIVNFPKWMVASEVQEGFLSCISNPWKRFALGQTPFLVGQLLDLIPGVEPLKITYSVVGAGVGAINDLNVWSMVRNVNLGGVERTPHLLRALLVSSITDIVSIPIFLSINRIEESETGNGTDQTGGRVLMLVFYVGYSAYFVYQANRDKSLEITVSEGQI